ncbi:MAG: FTR1 family protein, partial [Chloroflexota bacterium]|nr:FTR1 family protein [Chloroflexota bacterium]
MRALAPWTRHFGRGLLAALLVSLVLVAGAGAQAAPPRTQTDAARLDQVAGEVEEAAAVGDWSAARADWREFGELWLDVEDGFHEASPDAYASIEAAMVAVSDSLRTAAPDATAVSAAVRAVRAELAPFATGQAVNPGPAAHAGSGASLHDLLASLDRAIAAAERHEVALALGDLRAFQTQWLEVEGQIKTRSREAYRSTEDGMARAAADLRSAPPRSADALATMRSMRQVLAVFVDQPARYGLTDAAVILMREGLEALLVVAALLAFLRKAGHADKQRWIWAGAGLGVALSVVVALVIQRLFSAATSGASRELVEGVTGLLAAAMLLYVSYWLHSRANLQAWQHY